MILVFSSPYPPVAVGQAVSQLFFNKNAFGIKYSTKIDRPLNRETKPNLKSFHSNLFFLS